MFSLFEKHFNQDKATNKQIKNNYLNTHIQLDLQDFCICTSCNDVLFS